MLCFGFCCLVFLHTGNAGTAADKEDTTSPLSVPAAVPKCCRYQLLHFLSVPNAGREYPEVLLQENSNCTLKYQLPGINVAVDLPSALHQAVAVYVNCQTSAFIKSHWKVPVFQLFLADEAE